MNARHKTAKSDLTETAGFRIRDLNWADTQLYKHFSQKFSLLVKAFGSEKMSREVNELKLRTNEWYDYCVGNQKPIENQTKSDNQTLKQRDNQTLTQRDNQTLTLTLTQTIKTHKKPMIIRLKNRHSDNTTCWLLTAQEMDFTKFLRMRQMRQYPGSVFIDTKNLLKQRLRTIEELRKRRLKSKFLLINTRYSRLACKHCSTALTADTTTTIDPSEQLANALKGFTFKTTSETEE